ERDVAARVRERRALALQRRGADREAATATAVRARRLEQRRWVLDRVPVVELVARGDDDEDAMGLRVSDGARLERRRLGAAEAEVDDLRPVLDGVDDS